MTTLLASELVVMREAKLVLDKVSARFERGTLTAVIGPNGAGKSTLLSALAGLIAPTSGTVTADSQPIASMDRRVWAMRRSYLPQNPRIDWPISVEQLVLLGLTPTLSLFGNLPAAAREALDRTLAECDLSHLRHRAATALSGGELARAMLARTLVADPDILIVDEPTAGLDPRHAFDACARLRRHADAQHIVIAAMHDLDLAARYADHFVALREGRVVIGAAAEQALDERALEILFDLPVRIDRSGATPSVRFIERPEPRP